MKINPVGAISERKDFDNPKIKFSRTILDVTLLKQYKIIDFYKNLLSEYGETEKVVDTGICFGFMPKITKK